MVRGAIMTSPCPVNSACDSVSRAMENCPLGAMRNCPLL